MEKKDISKLTEEDLVNLSIEKLYENYKDDASPHGLLASSRDDDIPESIFEYFLINRRMLFYDQYKDVVEWLLNHKNISKKFIIDHAKYFGISLIVLHCPKLSFEEKLDLFKNDLNYLLFNEIQDIDLLYDAIKYLKLSKEEINYIFHFSPNLTRAIIYADSGWENVKKLQDLFVENINYIPAHKPVGFIHYENLSENDKRLLDKLNKHAGLSQNGFGVDDPRITKSDILTNYFVALFKFYYLNITLDEFKLHIEEAKYYLNNVDWFELILISQLEKYILEKYKDFIPNCVLDKANFHRYTI